MSATSEDTGNISGIAVLTRPERCDDVTGWMSTLDGVEVHQVDAPQGKIVATVEAPTVHDEIDRLKTIQNRPGVLSASMVYHYFAEAPG